MSQQNQVRRTATLAVVPPPQGAPVPGERSGSGQALRVVPGEPPLRVTGGAYVAERPWGQFQQFTSGQPVTVKLITVQPGHRLSLQRHGHREEFWQVLDTPMDVTVGDRSWVAQVGEQVWVPCGELHRLGNSSDRPCRVLEIAYGDFDECDIERLDDDYAR